MVFPKSAPPENEFARMPSNREELLKLIDCFENEKEGAEKENVQLLLEYMDSSACGRRNPFETFCILLGESGAGKTSTVKHLLDLDFPVSGKASDTTSVNAYTTETKCAERSVGDLKLTLVDTPGMNDTRGLNQDACNFHAIKTFCRENIQIDDKIMFPNIVLLCVPSTDKRIDGPESTFTKNLRTLKSLQVIDTDRPNLVIAVTHACALPNKKKSKWEEKKKSITENYQNIVRVSLGFEVPVVFLENEYEEEELKEDAEKRGTFLPDGEIQPVNLFKTLTEKARENEDEIALMVLREAYRDGAKGKLSANRSTPATVAEPDGSNLNEEEKTCKELLLSSSAIHQELQKTNEQEKKKLEAEVKAQVEENHTLKEEKAEVQWKLSQELEKKRIKEEVAWAEVLDKQQGRESVANEVPIRSKSKWKWAALALGGAALVAVGVAALVACAPAGVAITSVTVEAGAAATATDVSGAAASATTAGAAAAGVTTAGAVAGATTAAGAAVAGATTAGAVAGATTAAGAAVAGATTAGAVAGATTAAGAAVAGATTAGALAGATTAAGAAVAGTTTATAIATVGGTTAGTIAATSATIIGSIATGAGVVGAVIES